MGEKDINLKIEFKNECMIIKLGYQFFITYIFWKFV